ncbi:ubiquitin-like protein FUBI [Oryx dammah]|uniref:ubiquitin-like protein FUBI n=1 Tax=Oryx dammah TaxID=59534 RepID=UPI001A9AF7B1|nr:ubiquitin-like protein FUBI [Oryx dammah]
MQLFAPRSYTLQVTDPETAAQNTAQVALLEGISPENQVLLVAGTHPEDETTPGRFEVEALSTLEVAGCLLGGKAHGSRRAHARKARGQTPKVAKQEKKKTGQTERHRPCNQCFASVVSTCGKEKGPGANSSVLRNLDLL